LGYAHEHKIVHRDVKPVNIMFRDETQPVVTDFGIAKALDASQVFTQVGGVIGTPHYMSPEQAQGLPLDGRSDFYALGIMMYEVLVGNVPFDAPEPLSILYMHVQQPPPSLPDEFTALQPILDRLLAKLPEQRFQNTAQFSTALEPFIGKSKTGRVTVVVPKPTFDTILVSSAQSEAGTAQKSAADPESIKVSPKVNALIGYVRNDSGPMPLKHSRSVIMNILGGYSSAGSAATLNTAPTPSIKVIAMGLSACVLAFATAWWLYQSSRDAEIVQPGLSGEQPGLSAVSAFSQSSEPLDQSIRTELLSAVRSHMARGALIEPADNCALALVSRILEQAPTDPLALGLLKDIGVALSAQVRERWAVGKRAEALSLLRTGLDKLPNDLELNRTRADFQLELDRSAAVPVPVPVLTTDDVSELLKHAETLFGRSQWTTPAGDNAVEVLQRILALQPNQPRAIEMLNQIATGYEKVALTWRDRGRPDQALAQVRNGLKAQPTNARLLRLEQQLR